MRFIVSRSRRTTLLLALVAVVSGCGRKDDALAAVNPEPPVPPIEERQAFAVSPEGPGFAFAADGVGELLRERLTPPKSSLADPVPFTAEPRPWRAARLGGEAGRVALESALEATPRPRLLPVDRIAMQKPRPAVDVPPLAAEIEPVSPSRILFPVSAPAYAASQTADQPPLAGLGSVPSARVTANDDPTGDFSRRLALTVVELLRTQSAPFLRLSIPEPNEHQRLAPLRLPLTENEPPHLAPARPAVPMLPTK